MSDPTDMPSNADCIERFHEKPLRVFAGAKDTGRRNISQIEGAARAALEDLRGDALTEAQWESQRQGLIEYVSILSRWDAEQRDSRKGETMDSKQNAMEERTDAA